MRRKRQPISPWSLGSIPLTPVPNKSGYDPELGNHLRAEEEASKKAAEEAAHRESPLGKVEQQMNETLRASQERVKKFFSLPIEKMQEFSHFQAPPDMGEDFPVQTTERDHDAERALWHDFYEQLKARGIELSEDGWVRLMKYVVTLEAHRNIQLTPDTLTQALSRMAFLDCFRPTEIVKGQIPLPEYANPHQPQIQETEVERRRRVESGLEKFSAESREGRNECLKIINSQFGIDVERMYLRWADSMREKWGVDVMTPKIGKFAGDWFLRWNKNPLTPKNYDDLRLALNRQRLLSSLDCRTLDEKAADMIEEADLTNRDVRNELHRVHRLTQENPGRKGGLKF